MEPKSERVAPDAEGHCPEGMILNDAGDYCVETEQSTEPSERERGVMAERKRQVAIYEAATKLKLSPTSQLCKRMIESGASVEEAQAAFITWHSERVGANGPGPVTVPTGGRAMVESDVMDKVHEGVVGALLHRVNPGKWKLDENAKQYRSLTLMQAAEDVLGHRGIQTRGLGRWDLAKLAFAPLNIQVRAGFQTTSDFANILADVQNKILRAAYQESPQTWRTIARRVGARDFKSIKLLQLGEAPGLKKVGEHGEFERGTMTEGKEEFSLSTWGIVVAFTRQALINDDLDAFGRTATAMGRQAANKESDIVWYQIMAGKVLVMGDGNAIFSTAHANFTDSGAPIDVSTLDRSRTLMRKQLGLDGVTYLNLVPKYLIVGPSQETVAGQFTTVSQGAQILTPGEAANINPFAGALQVIVEPRLEGTVTLESGTSVTGDTKQWYMAADPGQVDILIYAQLDGDEGPVTDTRIGFDVDGVETKIREDFAAIVADYRGLTRDDGQ